ncbi:MAG TPA: hypothetical protein VKI99_00445, partial [Candidatus Dormibacteraeota bacterium]|nr:hypothetical protein [Candidatus Dormibacteraeota bacterium]
TLKLGSEAEVTLKVALASGTPDGSDFVTCSSPEGGPLVAEGVGVGPEGVGDGLEDGCAGAVSTSTTSGAAAVAAFVSAPRPGRRAGAVCRRCVSRLQRNVVQAFAALEPRQALAEHVPLEVLALHVRFHSLLVGVLFEQEEAARIVCRAVRIVMHTAGLGLGQGDHLAKDLRYDLLFARFGYPRHGEYITHTLYASDG